MKKLLSLMLIIVLAGLASLSPGGFALAHERRDAGRYQVVVGWIAEPAFEGQKNGVDFRVASFNDVESPAELQFPVKLREVREIEGAARGALDAAQKAQDGALSARSLALAGIGFGALGVALGAAAIVAGRKR